MFRSISPDIIIPIMLAEPINNPVGNPYCIVTYTVNIMFMSQNPNQGIILNGNIEITQTVNSNNIINCCENNILNINIEIPKAIEIYIFNSFLFSLNDDFKIST